ncbi:zinc finger protein 687a [Astyanax mexicanus]|uniref:Zinc finger protein 687a n=1 Tax=Astyanax mexicanus TaxID=7994 RepID=A0A8B9HPG0_ASTMX|nr:zinc finger protein 687a [Astyanax mexicanus]
MGDMKTPDFDDLLAAFDIPDIDAKEAIESNSGDPDGNQSESSGADGKEKSGGSAQKPTAVAEVKESVPLASNDPPVVSVIVKNSVCSDVLIKEEEMEEEEDCGTKRSEGDSVLPPKLEPREHSLSPPDSLIHNGFKASSDKAAEPSLHSSQPQMQPNGLWPEDDEKNHDGSSSSHSSVIFPPPVPLPIPDTSDTSANLIDLLPNKLDENEVEHPESLNVTSRTGVPRSEDEESEPDLGSPPLMIQESPDLQASLSPKFPRRQRKSIQLQPPSPSSPTLPVSNTQTGEATAVTEQHLGLMSSTPQETPLSNSNTCSSMTEKTTDPSNAERYPEHIIEERDSPESPEPEMPPCPQGKSLPPAPAQCSTNPSTSLPVKKEPVPEETMEETMDNEGRSMQEGRNCDPHVQSSPKEGIQKKVQVDMEEQQPVPIPVASAGQKGLGTSTAPSRPLKVRIKAVKTPTGNVTRTATRLAAKGAAKGATKGSESTKMQLGGRKVVTRPKRAASAASENSPVLPVSTLQDASTAMLFAASKVQKVSATLSVSSVKKPLPSPSLSSSPVGINVQSMGLKTVYSAVSSAKAASIVNSSGAVISRSQSSLVEAFNKILNSRNPLPSYQPDLSVPPPPEWGLGVPPAGYRCLECGDAFALERSLARHYDRRSLRIEVTCNHCSKRLAFFNKCSLLLHAREHKEKGLVMQCSHLVMRPVSMEQMIGQQDTVPIGVLSPSLLACGSLPAAKEETSGPPGIFDNRCPECKSPFSSTEELAAHFQEVDPSGSESSCMKCSPPMPLWNSCSAAAHRRLHQNLPPLVCPDCGLVYQPNHLNSHLQQSCLHYSRQLGYRCPCCQLVFGGVNSLNAVKTHMQTAHCEVFHKCPACPMAFKSAPSADVHCTAQHPTLTDTAKQSKEIYKCVLCQTVFTQKALLSLHFDTHLTKQKVHVFKCPDCNKLFTQRASLLAHMKASHRNLTVQPSEVSAQKSSVKMESSDGEDEEDGEREGVPKGKKGPATSNAQQWSCSQCQTRFSDKDNYINHMAKKHGKELKRFPCTFCERSFSSSSSMRRHMRVKHKGIKRSFQCQLCPEGRKTFSSKLVLDKHMQIHHGGRKGVTNPRQPSSRFTDTADSSSEQDGAPSAVTAGSAEEDEGHLSLDAGTRSAQGRDGDCFRCAPCGFTSLEKEEFLQHIQTHRGEGGRALQCQLCGACFASGSSLSRHRFISHRMRGTEPENTPRGRRDAAPRGNVTSDAPDLSPASPSQAEDGEDKLTCKVCGRQFSKAADLSTHFRTHGMAFITTYKTDKPA